jgi:DNA polymerase III alpha subunit (gram-positive type)
MSDHSQYEKLAALAAGGHLGDDELNDFQRHWETCAQCRNAVVQFGELVHFGLPLVQSRLRQGISMITSRTNPGATERFIKRASAEGIEFSRDVRKRDSSSGWHLSLALGAVASAALLVAIVYGLHLRFRAPHQPDQQNAMQAQQQLQQLSRQNSTLDATVSRLEHTLAEQQREMEGLRAQLTTQDAAATSARHNNEQALSAVEQSASRNAQSLEEAEAQRKVLEKQLADRGAELARLNQERASDQAELVAEQVHINQLSQQLKTATTNIDMERQLATAGKDVRDLMGARQLHVVDVRDTDPNGKAGKAFGRVFLTEGKSLIFYAFDLNDAKKMNAKQTFQVWGQQEGKTSSLRSLGFLYVDDKIQRRWALKTDDPVAVKEIDSVFVTLEPEGGARKPSSQRLLYAYLGEANHP